MMSDDTAAPDQPVSDDAEPMTTDLVEVEPADEPIDPHTLGLELPDDADEAIAVLLGEVAASRAEAAAYLDDLQRVAADFDNYRKRTQRDMAANVERASQRVLQSLMPVLDSLDLAADHEPQSPGEEKLLAGVRGTQQLLLDTLAKEGLEAIPAVGEDFDPELHEAVSTTAVGDGPFVVVAEMRRGYTLRGRVIRPALVTVGD